MSVRLVERIHRLGVRRNGKTRPVILKLYDYNKKTAALSKCKKLKGSNIFINNDYSQATLEKRKLLWASAKVERERNDMVQLIHDKLKSNGDLFIWNGAAKCRARMEQKRGEKV